jgi:hypothetical protein
MSIPDIVRGALTGAGATAFLLAALRFLEIWEAPVSPWTLIAVSAALFVASLLVQSRGEKPGDTADQGRTVAGDPAADGQAPDPLAASLAEAAEALSSRGTSDLGTLLSTMDPVLLDGEYVYLTVPANRDDWPEALRDASPLGTFEEEEGTSWIVARTVADEAEITYDAVFRGITLSVHSSLTAVGFLSVLTFALSEHGIAVNVVSATYHDHLFVPKEHARDTLSILRGLQAGGAEVSEAAGSPAPEEDGGAKE